MRKKIFVKILVCFSMISIVFPVFSNVGYVVNADTNGISSVEYTSEEQKQIDELTEIFDFMFNNAVIYDSLGNVSYIDFNVIYNKYGYSDELAEVEKVMNYEKSLRASAVHCAKIAIQDTIGVSALSGLIGGGIVGLLQRKATAEIAKLIVKVGFKNVAPAAAAASILWSFGRCMWF